MSIEAMKQALEALEAVRWSRHLEDARTIAKNARYSLRQAIEQAEKQADKRFEDVQVSDTKVWRLYRQGNLYVSILTQEEIDQLKQDVEQGRKDGCRQAEKQEPEQEPMRWFQQFGDAPPRKEWVGLTDDDVDWILGLAYAHDTELVKTVEAKLKDKNG
jgi:hypothetical protein